MKKVFLINFYRSPTRIFLQDGSESFELLSWEGTTQGCSLAMAMYALGLIPFVKEVLHACNQVWFADDASGADKLANLLKWHLLFKLGPSYGYFVNPVKCVLVVKPEYLAEAQAMFADTGVQICSDGAKDSGGEVSSEDARHLGAAIGSTAFKNEFIAKKLALGLIQLV